MASVQYKVSKTGKKTYYVVLAVRGRRKWVKAGTQKEAQKLKRQIESLEESKRIEKLGITERKIRVDDFFQDYADHVRLHTSDSTVQRYLGILNCFIVFLRMFHPGIKYLSQIKQEHIESYQKQRLRSIELKIAADGEKPGNHIRKKLPSPQTVNYEITVLRTAFTWAHDRELISKIPTKKVRPLKPENAKHGRLLSREECDLFLRTAERLAKSNSTMSVYYRTFKFLLNTGLRSGELCNLTWGDIDLKTGLISIQTKENWSPKSYAREFFLNQTCLDLLRTLDPSTKYVFQTPGGQLDKNRLRSALIKIARAAAIDNLTRVHDLRHTFNSLMQMNGVDPATMGRILGHKDLETTMIYTHQTAEHLKKSINTLNID